MKKSAGYSDAVARSIENRRREKVRMGLPVFGFHSHYPEDCGDERDIICILAEAARRTDPELRRRVTDRILNL